MKKIKDFIILYRTHIIIIACLIAMCCAVDGFVHQVRLVKQIKELTTQVQEQSKKIVDLTADLELATMSDVDTDTETDIDTTSETDSDILTDTDTETDTATTEEISYVADDEPEVDYTVYETVSDSYYNPADLRTAGVTTWGGYYWTWYTEYEFPGQHLGIPGRHTDEYGYICDEDGYLCVASSDLSKGTVIDTPFGKQGKVYDCGCSSGVMDMYVSWTV